MKAFARLSCMAATILLSILAMIPPALALGGVPSSQPCDVVATPCGVGRDNAIVISGLDAPGKPVRGPRVHSTSFYIRLSVRLFSARVHPCVHRQHPPRWRHFVCGGGDDLSATGFCPVLDL